MKTLQQKLITFLRSPRKMNALLFAGIIIGVFAYGIGIISTTVHIADAKTDSQSVAELRSDIAELENDYFQKMNAINQSEAQLFGLHQVQKVEYAYLNKETQLALNQ